MNDLSVQIVRFVEDHQPPIVACEFIDANGHRHTLIDKVLIFSTEWLGATSTYPQPGLLRCEVLDQWRDIHERNLVRITIDKPDGVESTEQLTEFVVLATQLSISQGSASARH